MHLMSGTLKIVFSLLVIGGAGTYLLASTIAYPLGLALAGILAADVLGVSGMLWVGAATAAGLTVFIFCVPSVRELESRRAAQARP